MKKQLSTIVFGGLGLCAGFTLCFVYVTLPEREANLPLSFPPQTVEQTAATVRVARDGGIYLGNKRVDSIRLSLFLKDHAEKGDAIVIRADRNAGFASISAILDACKTAGVWKVAFARETAE